MPTYEYLCEKCGHQFDKHQSMSEETLTVCPKELCGQKKWGKGKIKKLIGAGAGLIFKGSGFYITDYRSDKYKAAAKKDAGGGEAKPAAGATESKAASGSSESKPVTKTESSGPKSESKPAPK